MLDSNTVDELIEERDQLREYLRDVTEQKYKIEVCKKFIINIYFTFSLSYILVTISSFIIFLCKNYD